MLHVDAENFLVLDSESMWIKPTNMTKLFDEYFASPFVLYSNVDNNRKQAKIFSEMLDNVNYLVDIGGSGKWYIEHFMWYYDKEILKNMFEELGSLSSMIDRLKKTKENEKSVDITTIGIFEIVLYYAYLYKNRLRYNYREIDIDKSLAETFSASQLKLYKDSFWNRYQGNCGVIEHSMMLLTDDNIEPLAKVFKKNNLNIIRCDFTNLDNVKQQENFINIVTPNILAASQEHCFGINDKYQILAYENKYLTKLKNHISRLLYPQKFSFRIVLEPFSIAFYWVKWYFRKEKTIKKIK